MKHRLVVSRLKKFPGIWRVDGINEIHDRGKLGKHCVVHFAGIKESFLENAYSVDATNGEAISLRFHTAQLTRFRVGSLWNDGKLFQFSPHFSDFYEIDTALIKTVRLDEKVQIENESMPSILPINYFQFGKDSHSNRDNRQLLNGMRISYIPAKYKGKATWLIVPCSEVLRFYYGVSSRLLASTVAGDIEEFISYNDSNNVNNQITMFARKKLSWLEAGVLARTVGSDYAKAAMHSTHNFLSAATSRNQPKNVKESLDLVAGFPFLGNTKLFVSGKRMKLSKDASPEIWGIYAMQIWSCSHTFGFTNNPIIKMDENWQGMAGNNVKEKGSGFIDEFCPEEALPDIEEVPANARAKRITIIEGSNQFDGMKNIRFEHRYASVSRGKKQKASGDSDIHVEAITFEDGSYSSNAKSNLGINLFSDHVDDIGRSQTLFIDAIEEIKKLRPRWELISPNFGENIRVGGKSYLAQFPRSIAGVSSWHLIFGRPRQIVAVEIEFYRDKFAYLLEMELKADEAKQCTIFFFSKTFERIEYNILEQYFRFSARNNRWVGEDIALKKIQDNFDVKKFLSTYRAERFRHPSRCAKMDPATGTKTLQDVSAAIWASDLVENIDAVLKNAYGAM